MCEGTLDFINIVPRIALGVIGSGYMPPSSRRRSSPAGSGRTAAGLGLRPRWSPGAATPGGPVVGLSIGAGALNAGGGPPQVLAVCVPAAVIVGNPLHARPFRVVSGCGFRPVPIPGRRHRHGDRQAIGPLKSNLSIEIGPAVDTCNVII
jgi:hypothetical protein